MNEPSDDDSDDDGLDSFLREAARIPPLVREPERVGTRLGRYRIDAELGRGGMGIVYEAEDTELGRRVALKMLPRAAVEDDERRRRFLREARTAASVSHPNLAAIFDVGEAEGTVFLAMELVRGASLRARIAAAPDGMPIADAVGIARQIARGLGQAHAAGVVHRDLKPENVMMSADGDAKVVDFGLAKLAASGSSAPEGAELSTQEGKILGTPSYMAPEQAKGSRVGPTADVFSIGVVLYEMLVGKRPFAGTSLVEVLVAIARDDASPPSAHARRVTRALDRVVLRCLAKDPSARFADGEALAVALDDATANDGRRAIPTWALATVVVVVVGTVAAFAWPVSAPLSRPDVGAEPRSSAPLPPTSSTTPPIAEIASAAPVATEAASVTVTTSSIARPAPPRPSASFSSRASAPSSSSAPLRPATSPSVDPLARQK